MVCSCTLGCEFIDQFMEKELVYVTASALNLRGGPTTRSSRVKLLARGEELEVLEHQETWLKVRDEEDAEGWVHGDYVGDPAAVRSAYQAELKKRSSAQKARSSASRVRRQPKRPPQKEKVRESGPEAFSISEMMVGFPEGIVIDPLDPIGGEERSVGATDSGLVTIEFWGDPESLSRASMMISVVDVPGEYLSQNAELAARFVQNAVPNWKRDGGWMEEKLMQLTSKDIGEGGFNTSAKQVRFAFIKPLGTVRITVSLPDA